MIAFLASTPYHIFNCINLKEAYHKDEDAVLFLFVYCSYDENIVRSVTESGIFKKVQVLTEPVNSGSPVKFMLQYFFPNRKKAGAIFSETFDALYITRSGYIPIYIYTHMKKRNPDLKLYFYEEGLADYLNSIMPPVYKRIRIIQKIGYKNAYENIDRMYLYEPTLRQANLEQNGVPLPKISETSYAAIKKAFAVDKIDIPQDCRLVYLDQPFKVQLGFDIDDRHLLSLIEKVIPHENIYIKLHPGDTDISRYEGYKIFPSQPYPWEVIIGEMDLENIILVAVSSTAASSPRTVYGRETKVIFTNGMFPDTPFLNIEGQRRYFAGLQKLYTDQSRFAMPSSDEEFIQALENMR